MDSGRLVAWAGAAYKLASWGEVFVVRQKIETFFAGFFLRSFEK